MFDYKGLKEYRKQELSNIQSTLIKASELIAFIRVYGSMYDEHYEGFILNINNISEHYLQDLNPEVINSLYDLYSTLKQKTENEEEIFKQLRMALYCIPAFRVTETKTRRRRKNLIFFINGEIRYR